MEIGPEDSPWRPPYTVDTLFELPESDLHFEVLGGNLVLVPAPAPRHNLIIDRLHQVLVARLPQTLAFLSNTAVGLPNRDGPIPDLLVTSADVEEFPRWLPAAVVHTVVEVVSPSNAPNDRVLKTELYADAEIPCYWRVEQRPWKEHFGPVPAIVVRLRDKNGDWQQTIAAAGAEAELPVVIDADGTVIPVRIDPARLVGRRRS
jgi:Uma2 family endonuclease